MSSSSDNTSSLTGGTAATVAAASPPTISNTEYDLMLLQLCFDVSEFDDAEPIVVPASPSASQQQKPPSSGDANTTEQQPAAAGTTTIIENAFDPFSFVASRQQHVSLEQLEADLEKYAAHLNQTMLNCVHDEVYESFTHVAAQLGNTSKRLHTVRAPLAHYLERTKQSARSVESAMSAVESGLSDVVNSEMERRFFSARVESALLARSIHETLSLANHDPEYAGMYGNGDEEDSLNRSGNIKKNKDAASSVSPMRAAFGDVSSSSSSKKESLEQQQQDGGVQSSLVPSSASSPLSLFINERLPTACQSLYRLSQLLTDMAQCVDHVSSDATADTQRLELASFAESCSRLERSVISTLCSCFDACYRRSCNQIADMKRICELFCSMNKSSYFVDHFRDHVVRPLVEDVVSWRAASQARQSPEDAAKLLGILLQELENGPLGLIPLLQEALGGSGGGGGTDGDGDGDDNQSSSQDKQLRQHQQQQPNASSSSSSSSLLVIASWSATSDTIMKRALFLFNAGIPSHFRRHFVAANELLVAHEKKCSTATELCGLRTCAEVSLWVRKWNVDVYHALRQNELNDMLEKMFSQPDAFAPTTAVASDAASKKDADSLFQTAAVEVVFGKMKESIDPKGGVFLYTIQHRLLRDLLVTVQKLTAKGQGILEKMSGGGGNSSSQHADPAHNNTMSTPTSANEPPASLMAGSSSSSSSTQSIESVVSQWAVLRSDFAKLAQAIAASFPALIQEGCAGAWSDGSSAIVSPQDFVALLCEEITAAVSGLDATIKAGVVHKCMNNLNNVRLVKTAFTMTKKNVPTEASPFLRGALDPLAGFHKAIIVAASKTAAPATTSAATAQQQQQPQQLVQDVARDVLKQFAVIVKDIVVSSHKAQLSLSKLHRARGQAAAAEQKYTEATDRDKIVVQLYLDINELVNVMRKFGINAESFAPFKDLFALVKRAPWVLSGFEGEEPAEIEE